MQKRKGEREREREEQSFRVIVCYRSNDRNRFPTPFSFSRSFFSTLFHSLSLSLSHYRLIPVSAPAECTRRAATHRSSVPLSRFALFSAGFFHISAAPFRGDRISRTVDFISPVCSIPLLIPGVSSISRPGLSLSIQAAAWRKFLANFSVLNAADVTYEVTRGAGTRHRVFPAPCSPPLLHGFYR